MGILLFRMSQLLLKITSEDAEHFVPCRMSYFNMGK